MHAAVLASDFYSALATAVLFLHALFILWVVFGAWLTRSRPVLRWLHIGSCLGNPYGIAPLAVSIAPAGRLARTPCRNRAVPGWVPASLSGQACLSEYFRQRAEHGCGNCLPLKFGVLWSTNVDQPARSSLTGLSLPSRGQSQAAKVLLGEHDFANSAGLARS